MLVHYVVDYEHLVVVVVVVVLVLVLVMCN
jgi:hypothetical protein